MGINPRFLKKNKITSTSMIAASSGQANVLRLIDGNTGSSWSTIAQTSGTRTITVTFSGATTIDRIYANDINWKAFDITYNGSNGFNPAAYTVSNTETQLYIEFASVSVTSVTFTITDTITASQNVACSELYIGEQIFEMAALTGGVYVIKPEVAQKITTLSDGTTYKTFIRALTGYDIDLQNISAAERLLYLSLYNRNKREPFVFIPYPLQPTALTAVGFHLTFDVLFSDTQSIYGAWDGVASRVNWVNPFEIENHDENIRDNPYTGIVNLRQASGI